jgi:hypothetical protein
MVLLLSTHTCCWCSLDLGEAWGYRPSKYDTSFVVSQGRVGIKLADQQSTHLIRPTHPLRRTVSPPQSVCVDFPAPSIPHRLPIANWSILINNSMPNTSSRKSTIPYPVPPPTSKFVYWINSSLVWHAWSRSNSNEYCTIHTSSPQQHSLPRPSIKMGVWRLIVLRARAFLGLNGTTVVEWIMGDWVSNMHHLPTCGTWPESYSTQQTRWFRPGSPNTSHRFANHTRHGDKTCSYTSNWYPLTTDSCIAHNSAGSLSQSL